MRLACLCLLAWAIGCQAQTTPTAEVDRRTQAFLLEKIPSLEIDRLTLKESLDIVRREWERRHPQESFPVGLSETANLEGGTPKLVVTLKLANVPFAEAIRYLGMQGGKQMVEHEGFFTLRDWEPVANTGWDYRDYFLNPKALATLSIQHASSPMNVRRAFFELGVDSEVEIVGVPSAALILWLPDQSRLLVRATPDQHDQVRGIVSVLNRGYRLTKPAAQTSGE